MISKNWLQNLRRALSTKHRRSIRGPTNDSPTISVEICEHRTLMSANGLANLSIETEVSDDDSEDGSIKGEPFEYQPTVFPTCEFLQFSNESPTNKYGCIGRLALIDSNAPEWVEAAMKGHGALVTSSHYGDSIFDTYFEDRYEYADGWQLILSSSCDAFVTRVFDASGQCVYYGWNADVRINLLPHGLFGKNGSSANTKTAETTAVPEQDRKNEAKADEDSWLITAGSCAEPDDEEFRSDDEFTEGGCVVPFAATEETAPGSSEDGPTETDTEVSLLDDVWNDLDAEISEPAEEASDDGWSEDLTELGPEDDAFSETDWFDVV